MFRPQKVKNWDVDMFTRWIKYLGRNGALIENGRRVGKAQEFVNLLYLESHIYSMNIEPTRLATLVTIS